jgi:BlaI family penicillinase repressor
MRKRLSDLEQLVMNFVWAHPNCTVDACRQALVQSARPLKESTVRTLLHRLEKKDYVRHHVDARTNLYQAKEPRRSVAAQSVKQIVDRLCDGSIEQMLVGMVDNKIVSRRELERIAQKIASRKKGE